MVERSGGECQRATKRSTRNSAPDLQRRRAAIVTRQARCYTPVSVRWKATLPSKTSEAPKSPITRRITEDAAAAMPQRQSL